MQISEQTRWRVTIAITVFFGIAAIVIGASGIKALNGAFGRAESALVTGFTRTESTLSRVHETSVETHLIMALGSKGDRPMWRGFLKRATEKAVDAGYLRTTRTGFVTMPEGEKLLSGYIQEQIQDVAKENPGVTFQELTAMVIEKLAVRRLTALARSQGISVDEMIGIVGGFAERLRTEAE